MSNIDLKRMKIELMRVQAARLEMEVQIDQKMIEIDHLKKSMDIQKAKETELEQSIKSKEGK